MEEVIQYLSLERFSGSQRDMGPRGTKGIPDRGCCVGDGIEATGEKLEVGSRWAALANHLGWR